jgi:hypothetical protein
MSKTINDLVLEQLKKIRSEQTAARDRFVSGKECLLCCCSI